MANTIRALLPDGTLPVATEQQVRDLIQSEAPAPDLSAYPTTDEVEAISREFGTPPGSIPVFPTLAEAIAWETGNPGRTALTIENQEPDTVPPSSAGILTVEPGYVFADLSVAGASDDRGITGYAFRVNAGAWSTWQSGPKYTATGLTAATSYTFQHKVRDVGLNELEGVAVTEETTAVPPLQPGDIITSDGFTGDGTGARTTDVFSGGTPMSWAGTVTTAGGRATLANNGTLAHFPAYLPVGRADFRVEVAVPSFPTAATSEVVVRSAASCTLAIQTGGGINISVAGAWTSLGTRLEVGDVLAFEATGTTGTLLVNGAQRWTGAIGAEGSAVGVMCRNGAAFDALKITAL